MCMLYYVMVTIEACPWYYDGSCVSIEAAHCVRMRLILFLLNGCMISMTFEYLKLEMICSLIHR